MRKAIIQISPVVKTDRSLPFPGACLLAILPMLLPMVARAESEATEAERLFTLKVLPLLSEKCFGCHGIDPKTGKEKFKGELDMRSREASWKGGEAIDNLLVPGSSAKSFRMTAVKWEDEDYEMPPKENDRLTEEQIGLVAKWIDADAPWPNEEKQAEIVDADKKRSGTHDGVLVDSSGGLGDEWTYRRAARSPGPSR